jgi:hypothetical protein
MRSWLTLLALTLAVGGLAGWLFYTPHESEQQIYAVSMLKPADITRIKLGPRVSARDAAPAPDETVLEKHDGQWRFTAPFKARAETFPIERLLSILEARSTVRYPASDLARYGLDKPLAVLTANDQAIAYGGINPTTQEQYVLAGNQVLVVPLNYAAALPRAIDTLLDKAVFAADEKQPVRFDLPEFTVALEEGTWAVAPIASEAGPDERNAWVEAWKNASALTVSLYTSPAPSDSVKVTLKDGRTITLGIAQRTPDVVLVREDDGVAYHFFADAGRKLLAPPTAAGAEPPPK